MNILNIRPIVTAVVSSVVVATVLFGGTSFVFASAPTPLPCTTGVGSPLLVDVTQQVTNDPDSGNFGGDWALDNFTRHIQVWQEPLGNYCAQADDIGTFTTFGGVDGKNPQSGDVLPIIITGTMTGGTHGEITGATFVDAGALSDIDCSVTPATCSSGLTSYWVQNYFPGGAYAYDNGWGWTYTSSLGEAWVNASTGSTGDIHSIFNSTTQIGYATIQGAIDAASDGDSINLAEGTYELSSELYITKPLSLVGHGVVTLKAANPSWSTVNGEKHLLGIFAGTELSPVTISNIIVDADGKSHAVNTYGNAYGILNDVTIKNGKGAGLTVNGSTIVATNLITSGNTWGAVNVDPGSGVTTASVFTLTSGTLAEGTQIWSDGAHVSEVAAIAVNAAGYSMYKVGGTTAEFLWTNRVLANAATLTSGGMSTLFTTIQDAINAASSTVSDTIVLGADVTTTIQVNVNKAVTIDGNGHTLHAAFEKTSNSNNSAIGITHSDVTIENLIVDGATGGQVWNLQLHGINVYKSTGVNLDMVTVSNFGGAGVVVNGSLVTVNDIITSGNAWGGINVDQGSGVTLPATLTVNGVSLHTEVNAAIWIDDTTKDVHVVDTNSQYSFTDNGDIRVYALNTTKVKMISDVQQTSTGGGVTVTVDIPSGTIITGNLSWDGTVDTPTATTTTVTVSGFDTTVTSAIAIGSSDSDLTFDKAVKLTFAGQTGKHIGWYNHTGIFTEVTEVCVDNTQVTNDLLTAGGSCKFDNGTDMIVWTKHFSIFTTYTQTATPAPVSSGGGGGGGGGAPIGFIGSVNATTLTAPVTPPVGQTTPLGQVLGAVAYNFAVDLTIGSHGTDVIELQNLLVAAGFSIPAGATGYFGAQTKAAVQQYQAAHGVLPLSGFVGPLTRAELNKGTAPSTQGSTVFTFTRYLAVGSSGADVTALQNLLAKIGGYTGPITGYFGSLTKAAVVTFQATNGLPQEGSVGPLTRALLNKGL